MVSAMEVATLGSKHAYDFDFVPGNEHRLGVGQIKKITILLRKAVFEGKCLPDHQILPSARPARC